MFDPDLFWQRSEALLGDPKIDECGCRIAAGRAYYAFYLTLRNRLETGQNPVKFAHGAGDHGMLVQLLRKRNKRPMAQALGLLYRLREDADYELGKSLKRSQVLLMMEQARPQYANARTL